MLYKTIYISNKYLDFELKSNIKFHFLLILIIQHQTKVWFGLLDNNCN